jgi:riboflavin kinase/FMN adenylyltransferase
VRQLIQSGAVGQANQLLTQPYRLTGVVGHGAERGRTIGFPTANLEQVQTVLPALGVYAGRAWADGQAYAAAINIGPNPTFGEQAVKIEVHLIDFAGNLYDRPLSVDLLERLRDVRPFSSAEALVTQLRLDVANVKAEFRRQKAEGGDTML